MLTSPMRPAGLTHYQLLKVQPDAPPSVIRAAFRALASQLHPDRRADSASERAHEEMAHINAAYEVLMDPQRRARYDAELDASVSRVQTAPLDSGDTVDRGPRTRINLEWADLDASASSAGTRSNKLRRDWLLIGAATVLAMGAGSWISTQQTSSADAEQAVAAHLSNLPHEAASGAVPSPMEAQSINGLITPIAPGAENSTPAPTAPARAAALEDHLLDGSPLRLRTDAAIPAAPAAAPRP